jgi:hypothetical protein
VSRKNPWAAINAFGRLTKARPSAPTRLVIKINNSSLDISVLERVRRDTADLGDRVTIIDAR